MIHTVRWNLSFGYLDLQQKKEQQLDTTIASALIWKISSEKFQENKQGQMMICNLDVRFHPFIPTRERALVNEIKVVPNKMIKTIKTNTIDYSK